MKSINQKNQEQLEQTGDVAKISAEVLDHMIKPKNYGVMKDHDGIGKCVNKKTDEFAMVYIKLNGEILVNISFGCDASQDTVVAGSLFTEMVKRDTLDNAIQSLRLMDEQIQSAPKEQQASSGMILQAFRAAIINKENRVNGMDEDMFSIDLKEL